jgi:hypothetical protein
MPMADEHADDRQRLVDYLLGSLPEEEAERLDELSIADDEFGWRLRAVENDLIDEYARGELSEELQSRFRSAFLATPQRRARVTFAKSLLARQGRPATGANIPLVQQRQDRYLDTARRVRFQPVLAAAAVLALVAAGYLLVQNVRLQREVTQALADRATLTKQAQDLESQLQGERSTMAGVREELSSVREELARVRPSVMASFLLTPQTRGVGQVARVSVPRGARELTLRLVLESDDYPAYEASLKDPATGRILWRSAPVKAAREGDRRVVSITIPADGLKGQTYSVDLSGQMARGSSELLTSYPFRVVLM